MKINSLKFNNSTIHKMYHGNELVNKIGDAFTYMEASGDTPTPPTPVPYSGQYLTFVANADNLTIGLTYANNNVFQYSTDNGATWSNLANNESTSSVNNGETIMFKASGLRISTGDGIGTLTPSVSASVQGNVMSLVYADDFVGQTTISTREQFRGLFYQCTNLTSAENLVLPATTLTSYCYGGMFAGCTGLTTAPELSATTLGSFCYRTMFYGCTSLTVAPVLPATTMETNCYESMFVNCTSLTTAPVLPATTLAEGCYKEMFSNCTNLTAAPVLSATTLADNCYQYMFSGCTSLTTAPVLSATTLAIYCCSSMFRNCTSLRKSPDLLATTLASSCYDSMFYGCTNLNYIKAMFTTKPDTKYLKNWVTGVANTGTFVKNSAATWTNSFGPSAIPKTLTYKWTVQTASA